MGKTESEHSQFKKFYQGRWKHFKLYTLVIIGSNPYGIQLLTRLRLGLGYLRLDQFKHIFQETPKSTCNCGEDTETLYQYLLHYLLYTIERLSPLNVISNTTNSFL